MKKGQRKKRKRNRELQKRIKKIIARFRHSPEKISGGDPMVFVITAQTKKDSQAAHTDFTRSVYMEATPSQITKQFSRNGNKNTVMMLMKRRWRSNH